MVAAATTAGGVSRAASARPTAAPSSGPSTTFCGRTPSTPASAPVAVPTAVGDTRGARPASQPSGATRAALVAIRWKSGWIRPGRRTARATASEAARLAAPASAPSPAARPPRCAASAAPAAAPIPAAVSTAAGSRCATPALYARPHRHPAVERGWHSGRVHPRPQFARERWVDLSGSWGFAYDDGDVGRDEGWPERADVFDREVRVPYPPESPASGIGDPGFHPVVWYRRTFAAPQRRAGERLLLHFGAVDYRASGWVNGRHAG